jgi:hypothetical protein
MSNFVLGGGGGCFKNHIACGISECHMSNIITYLVLRCVLGYSDEQQFSSRVSLHDIGVQVRFLISWHEYVQ